MFELKKLAQTFEEMTPSERGILLVKKAAKIRARLACEEELGVSPSRVLAGFIIGSAVVDGKVDEKEYLLMYPSLIRAFGCDFDYESIKKSFCGGFAGKKTAADYVDETLRAIEGFDDELKTDVVVLCMCVMSVDGKVSLKERRYLKKLLV